jgi:hypothetical protein
MTVDARMRPRPRKHWPWRALLLVLSPSLGGAAPPLDASPLTASAHNAPSSDASLRAAQIADAPVSPDLRRRRIRNPNIHIGRIFFSAAERRRRDADNSSAADPGADRSSRAGRLEINGAVSSSAQGRAVWVNGTAIENSAKVKPAWTDRAGSVWLRDERHLPRLVRPGQAMDPTSGAIEDLLPAGSVARR